MNDLELPTIRWTEPHEKDQFGYSYSIVEAILTCPVWGLTRYYKKKYWPTKRQMALEAGSQMHEVFAAVRCWQLWRVQGLYQHFRFHAIRLFGEERLNACWKTNEKSPRDELLHFVFHILNSGEFYDDPDDRIRTIANMEETTIRYVDEMMARMKDNPIWVADRNDPTAPVGIEQVFDVMVTWKGKSVRYLGTIDGITQLSSNDVQVDENKTASRLDEVWRTTFQVKQQPTGYIFVARLLTKLWSERARIIGIKIKQTKSQEDFYPFIEEREAYQFVDWARSLFFAADLVERYGDDPITAPQFTHSCNRYFRACAFTELCAASPEDRRDMYENSMVDAPLTPTQEAVLAQNAAG
jgi:hypothetical protein